MNYLEELNEATDDINEILDQIGDKKGQLIVCPLYCTIFQARIEGFVLDAKELIPEKQRLSINSDSTKT